MSMKDVAREIAEDLTDGPCIRWPGTIAPNGYGNVFVDGKCWGAHRYVCFLAHGEPDDWGMDAAHAPIICHNRWCVRPSHLRWSTRANNLTDRSTDGTVNNGERNGQVKLLANQVLAIKADSRTQRVIADDYGVSQSMVSLIKLGKKWRHV